MVNEIVGEEFNKSVVLYMSENWTRCVDICFQSMYILDRRNGASKQCSAEKIRGPYISIGRPNNGIPPIEFGWNDGVVDNSADQTDNIIFFLESKADRDAVIAAEMRIISEIEKNGGEARLSSKLAGTVNSINEDEANEIYDRMREVMIKSLIWSTLTATNEGNRNDATASAEETVETPAPKTEESNEAPAAKTERAPLPTHEIVYAGEVIGRGFLPQGIKGPFVLLKGAQLVSEEGHNFKSFIVDERNKMRKYYKVSGNVTIRNLKFVDYKSAVLFIAGEEKRGRKQTLEVREINGKTVSPKNGAGTGKNSPKTLLVPEEHGFSRTNYDGSPAEVFFSKNDNRGWDARLRFINGDPRLGCIIEAGSKVLKKSSRPNSRVKSIVLTEDKDFPCISDASWFARGGCKKTRVSWKNKDGVSIVDYVAKVLEGQGIDDTVMEPFTEEVAPQAEAPAVAADMFNGTDDNGQCLLNLINSEPDAVVNQTAWLEKAYEGVMHDSMLCPYWKRGRLSDQSIATGLEFTVRCREKNAYGKIAVCKNEVKILKGSKIRPRNEIKENSDYEKKLVRRTNNDNILSDFYSHVGEDNTLNDTYSVKDMTIAESLIVGTYGGFKYSWYEEENGVVRNAYEVCHTLGFRPKSKTRVWNAEQEFDRKTGKLNVTVYGIDPHMYTVRIKKYSDNKGAYGRFIPVLEQDETGNFANAFRKSDDGNCWVAQVTLSDIPKENMAVVIISPTGSEHMLSGCLKIKKNA